MIINNYFTFLQFYLTSLWGKEYRSRVFFGPLEPETEPLEKKIPGAGAA